MNTLLLETDDFYSPGEANISGDRARHLIDIVGVEAGNNLRCGAVNGLLGSAVVVGMQADKMSPTINLEVDLTTEPPLPCRFSLLCALPRPKMLRRMLRTCAELGVKDITLINSARVEKSYWQSPNLHDNKIREFFLEGLSQAGDTILPSLKLEKRFKPFVEDRLPELLATKQHVLLAHPKGESPLLKNLAVSESEGIVAMGPEGGFIDYEVEKLEAVGFQRFSLGPRILRCDTALPVIVAGLS